VAHTETETREKTLADTILDRTGVDVRECYQCGKCTAGCPMARFMDLAPSQVMRLTQIGDAQAVDTLLASSALWSCVGCLTCTQRCPKDLDPAAVMDALREIAYEEGRVPAEQRKVLRFHQAFLETVKHAGRMSEVPLTALYKTLSGDFFSDVTLAPAMLLRGKLPLIPKVISGRKEVGRIFEKCLREQEGEEDSA
jgi:heterodisulfide reductase subunit C